MAYPKFNKCHDDEDFALCSVVTVRFAHLFYSITLRNQPPYFPHSWCSYFISLNYIPITQKKSISSTFNVSRKHNILLKNSEYLSTRWLFPVACVHVCVLFVFEGLFNFKVNFVNWLNALNSYNSTYWVNAVHWMVLK